MPARPSLKLIHHKHTGKVVHRRQTSWPGVVFIALLAGLTLLLVSSAIRASQTAAVTVGAIIPVQPPATAPVITDPHTGQSFATSPINVSGNCIRRLRVEVYKNHILAGSTLCTDRGRFSLPIDLLVGENRLTAKQFNSSNQASPESNVVTVTFRKNLGGILQFLILTPSAYQGAKQQQPVTFELEIVGGSAPYALSIDWGDGSVEPVSVAEAGQTQISHRYVQAGNYQPIIKGSDNKGQQAFLEVLAVISGQVRVAAPIEKGLVLILWPLYILMTLLIASFWLGDRYELQQLQEEHQLKGT